MNNKLYNIVKIVAGVLGILGLVLLVRVMMAGDDVKTDAAVQASVVDPFVTFTFFMLGLAVVLTVVFSLLGLLKNPKALKKALISLAVLGVLFGIAYAMSTDAAVTDKFGQVIEFGEKGPISKRVGTLINYTYILGAIGLVCVLWGSLKGMFSK